MEIAKFSLYTHLLAVCTLLSLLSAGRCYGAQEYKWDFKSRDEVKGWEVSGTSGHIIKERDVLYLERENELRLIAPEKLNFSIFKTPEFNRLDIPTKPAAMIRIRMRNLGQTKVTGIASCLMQETESSVRTLQVPFHVNTGDKFSEYIISFDDIPQTGANLSHFAFLFHDGPFEISWIKISFENELADQVGVLFRKLYSYNEFVAAFGEESFFGKKINRITTPIFLGTTMPLFLFMSVLLFSLIAIIFNFKFHGSISRSFAVKALIICFLCSGTIFAARMDLNWIKMLIHDFRDLGGKTIQEKIGLASEDDLFQFITFIKKYIPEGKKVKTLTTEGDNYISKKGYYYLLPLETSHDAEYIWTYKQKALYDDANGKLGDGANAVSPLKLIASYRKGAELFQVVKPAK